MIANAAVHAMGEQAIPRESLTWHLGSTLVSEEKKFLALKQQAQSPDDHDEILQWPTPEHPPFKPSRQVAKVMFASVVMSQNISNGGGAEKHVEWRRLVPIICIALVVSFIA